MCILESIIDEMIGRKTDPSILWTISKHIYIMYTTGPMLLDNVYDDIGLEFSTTFLPQQSFFPKQCDICSEKPCFVKNSSVRVLQGSSWVSADTKFLTFISCNTDYILIVLCIIVYFIFTR